jgi:DNA topoisomerase-3
LYEMKTLVIAEKPSVAQDIVKALTPVAGKFDKHDDHYENDEWVISSAVGHLVEIAAPEAYDVKRGKWTFAHLPVLPPHFDLKPIDKTKSRLNAVVKLAKRKDVGRLINACDAGREGELIFRLIMQYAGGKKPLDKPIQRLWLQSMTPQAIRDGFEQLRSDADMLPLADAARCRSEADWLVGINGTRAMTAFNSRDGGFFLTTVGRVQTPTLSIVVEREEAIRRFVPRTYYEVHAEFAAQAGAYSGRWFDPQWRKPTGDDADEHAKDHRLWNEAQAQAIAQAVAGKPAVVTETSKSSTKASPALFDLTSLQKEANGRFGFSAKTTLQIAQSLYERHKALTYPRTDARALPEDYLPTVKQTFEMLADSSLKHLGQFAQQALSEGWVRKLPKVFDNSKISDHFAIIPTLQAPQGLSEAEQKIYDLVTRRFMAVFFPPAEYLVTERVSQVGPHAFRTDGKILVKEGWLAIFGKEADEEESSDRLPVVQPNEQPLATDAEVVTAQTRPPARYSEATLLSAMDGAGKVIEDEELRAAMVNKGLGTPATRAAIIEGLLAEKYMFREGRELIPTAKAFQLMTLLRGLGVDELSRPELTGEWEFKLAQMERGELSREAFMREIASMTEHLVRKAKEYDRDTIPGDYATLHTPCPQCGGVVKENYRRYACTGASGASEGCGFSFTKSPAGRTFEVAEAEAFLKNRRIGPLEGFRSKAGWPFTAEMALVHSAEDQQWKLEFDFGDDAKAAADGEAVDLSEATEVGKCPSCGSRVVEQGTQYVCERAVPTADQAKPSCSFKSGKIILQQPVSVEQMQKLLSTGKTDLLDKFVSARTRRAFKAFLSWDAKAGKVVFEFEAKAPKGAKGGSAATKTAARKTTARKTVARKAPARKSPSSEA